MLRFRTTTVDDPDARALLAEYFAERSASFPAAQGDYRVTLPTADTFADGVFLVVEDDGSPIGCGALRRLPGDPVRDEVKHLFVRPAGRGTGAGRALLVELERRARERGAEELVLDTNRSLTAAGALYARAGFVPIPPYNDNPNATDWYGKRLAGDAAQ